MRHTPYKHVTQAKFFLELRDAEMAAGTIAEERVLEDRVLYVLGERTFGYKIKPRPLGDPHWYLLKETP